MDIFCSGSSDTYDPIPSAPIFGILWQAKDQPLNIDDEDLDRKITPALEYLRSKEAHK